MRLAAFHRNRGDEVRFFSGEAAVARRLDEPTYDRVYASAIFEFSAPLIGAFRKQWPEALVGGTGTDNKATLEKTLGHELEAVTYEFWPAFRASLGFTMKGCRFACGFCCVRGKEGRPYSVSTVPEIWRGPGFPKKLHLLDNDFFGQAKDQWKARLAEIRDGSFVVSFSQGINVRVITDEIAAELASIEYRDDQFRERRLYCAWDNIGDEALFFRGVERLGRAGIPPQHVMAFMLIGWADGETEADILYRVELMRLWGILPYVMPFDCRATDPERYRHAKAIQRWVNTGLYRSKPFEAYDVRIRSRVDHPQLALT